MLSLRKVMTSFFILAAPLFARAQLDAPVGFPDPSEQSYATSRGQMLRGRGQGINAGIVQVDPVAYGPRDPKGTIDPGTGTLVDQYGRPIVDGANGNPDPHTPPVPEAPVNVPVTNTGNCSGADASTPACVCAANPTACRGTAPESQNFGASKNAESTANDTAATSKKEKATRAAIQAMQDSLSASQNPNVINVVSGQAISTRSERQPAAMTRPSEKAKDASVYSGEETAVTRSPANEGLQQQPRIAWSVGSKKKITDFVPEANPPQGYTAPGGLSNFEKVRQRYYDNAGTFDRPNELPPSPK